MTNPSFLSLSKLRRSVRKYSDLPIAEEDLLYILECARLAPSACNLQPWEVIVIDDPAIIGELSKCAAFGLSKTKTSGSIAFIADAPVVLALCSKRKVMHKLSSVFDMDYSKVDLGIFGEHIALAAASLGIGSCWVGMASERRVRPILNLKKGVELLCLISLGYPAGDDVTLETFPNPPKPRKELSEFVFRNEYGRRV